MRVVALLAALTAAAPLAAQQPSPDSARVYALGEVEVPPRAQNAGELTTALHQSYPPHLRAEGVGGTVQVAFVIGADGEPRDVRVVSASDSSFSAPSAQAVSLLRFSPAQVHGRPVPVRVEQAIVWRTEAPPPVAVAAVPVAPPTGDDVNGYELGAVTEFPRLRNPQVFMRALEREYPPALRQAGHGGLVHVRFRVEPDGTPRDPVITHTSDPAFVEPTLRALAVMRFTPARLNGRPVPVWVNQPIQWAVMPEPDPVDPVPAGQVEPRLNRPDRRP